MKNPHTKDPGYVIGFESLLDGWIVVYDRQQIENYYPERAAYRWQIRHINSGKFKVCATKHEARIQALRASKASLPFQKFWECE